MQGLPADPATRVAVLDALRCHDDDETIASFLAYWSALGLVAGVYAAGATREVRTQYVDWYRGPPGQARYMPNIATLRADLDTFILQGWTPTAPPICRDRLTTALGSCFADEIRLWLRAKGYRVNDDFRSGKSYPHLEDSAVPLLQCSAGLVNTFVLLQQFEWAFEGRTFDDDIWRGSKGSIALPTEAARLRTREMFAATSLFVVTLGLAEVWFQRRSERAKMATTAPAAASDGTPLPQGEERRARDGSENIAETAQGSWLDGCDVLWRAVPSDVYDPARHGFRVTTVAENVANLRRLVSLVREHVPGASIVFTLSPVPLAATFRGVSCVTANSASKAILRAAVDELLREHGVGGGGGGADGSSSSSGQGSSSRSSEGSGDSPGLYYWPAYEMVKEGFADPYLDDGRHPKPEVISAILELFGRHYLPAVRGQSNTAPPL